MPMVIKNYNLLHFDDRLLHFIRLNPKLFSHVCELSRSQAQKNLHSSIVITLEIKKMGLRSYLSAFICIALISGKVSAKRPKYVPQKIMQLGCLPGSNVCPAQMYCLIDPNYAYFGTCACAGLHGKELAPPTYDENVPELTMSKSSNDCKQVHLVLWVTNIFWFMYVILFTRLIAGNIMLIWRVYKNGGAKLSSSYLSIFGSVGANAGTLCHCITFFLVRANWDTNWAYVDAVFHVPIILTGLFGYWYRLEIICTWFDLFQKSVSMSKRSTFGVQILRHFCKLTGLASMVFGLMSALELGDYARLLKLSTTVLPIILTTACLVVAPLLIRVLCKDMRNVTHPNWKAAAAIRRSAFNQPFSEMALFAGVRAYTATSFWAYQGAIIVNAILVVMWFYRLVSAGEWFGYMLFAHRRHLKEGETARISKYFGFTTLGLNGSIASEIMSRISSVTSSVVDDKEEDTESKKEIA
jgi:hypothetical protein